MVQDWSEGEKSAAKDWCSSVSEWQMVGRVSTRRVKGVDLENSQTVGRGFMIRC